MPPKETPSERQSAELISLKVRFLRHCSEAFDLLVQAKAIESPIPDNRDETQDSPEPSQTTMDLLMVERLKKAGLL